MTVYDATEWHDLFVATAGATAALAGLVFVAVSIFLEAGGGLYWVVAGILFATIGAVANAWVLLIEILR